MIACVSGSDELELRAAELAATGGPVFDLGPAAADLASLVLHEFDMAGLRHVVVGDQLVVHHNDRARARWMFEELVGVGYEIEASHDAPRAEWVDPSELEVVYSAGDLVQGELIRARLKADGIDSRLRYDPTTTMGRHLAYDRTIEVLVHRSELQRARDVLDGVDTDAGSVRAFRSRAWATPMRRLGAAALLATVAVWFAGFVLPLARLVGLFE